MVRRRRWLRAFTRRAGASSSRWTRTCKTIRRTSRGCSTKSTKAMMKFASWPHHADFVQTPLPVLTMVMLVLGVQFFFMGLLAEMLVRTYHESQSKPIYAVKERIGFE